MGYVPPPTFVQRYADGSTSLHFGPGERTLRRRIEKGRRSRLPWRRRRAHDACLELIRRNEIELDGQLDAPPKRADARASAVPRDPAKPATR